MLRALVKALSRLAKGIVGAARRLTSRNDINADLVREVTLIVNSQKDSKVCELCRSMDGRRIKMPLLASRNFMFEYGNLEKTKWMGQKKPATPISP